MSYLRAFFMWMFPRTTRFLAWLTSPGERMRVRQAKRLWSLGIGHALGFRTFAEYLETIERPSAEILADDADDPYLVLVEPRIPLTILCKLCGVKYDHSDGFFEPYDARHTEFIEPTWIRLRDGRSNHLRVPRECREAFSPEQLGLTALQAICSYAQYPGIVTEASDPDGHAMELVGSVYPHRPDTMAEFGILWGIPSLCFSFTDNLFWKSGVPNAGWRESGTASRKAQTSPPNLS